MMTIDVQVQPNLRDKRILVVEDEYFIASDLKRALGKVGATVVGPVGDLAAGLRLARSEAIDAAVLDVNLDGSMSYPLADALAEAEIPVLFLTGYDGWSMPDAYREAPRLAKPCSIPSVIGAVEKLCGDVAS